MATFTYNKARLARSALLLGATAVWIILLMAFIFPFDIVSMTIIVIMMAALLLVMGISPLLTFHEVNQWEVVLRQGWHFTLVIPMGNIQSISREDAENRRRPFLGMPGVVMDLSSGRHGRMSIKLRKPQRFNAALARRTEEIIFDVKDPERFQKKVEEYLGATPSNQAR